LTCRIRPFSSLLSDWFEWACPGSLAWVIRLGPSGYILFLYEYASKVRGATIQINSIIATQLLVCFLVGCGSGEPAGSRPVAFETEFEVVSAAPGIDTDVVSVDSVAWRPFGFRLTPSNELEVDGSYEIHFRNSGDRRLVLRYDLRFLDRDGFFVDSFIPFGLPLELEPQGVTIDGGEFTIESVDLRHPDDLRTMFIAATIAIDATVGE
jgi:hypothetical protein